MDIKNIFSWACKKILSHGNSIQIFANIVTIIAIVPAIIVLIIQIQQFNTQIENQRISEFNKHLSNIKSLQMELNLDVNLMNDTVANRGSFVNKTFHNELLLENLKRSVSDGEIQNAILKNWIMVAYFDAMGLNNRVLYINSPEFDILILSNATRYSKDMQHFQNQTFDAMGELIRPIESKPCQKGDHNSFSCALTILNSYKNCLDVKKSIDICNNNEVLTDFLRKDIFE